MYNNIFNIIGDNMKEIEKQMLKLKKEMRKYIKVLEKQGYPNDFILKELYCVCDDTLAYKLEDNHIKLV